ncbi:hypoxanthine phosphoribosyltransferase [Parvularcula flava]|uniref:Hypoxanthine phosphoribosyltransferase n=1 Tax=Aquisalinus luteolus TaxID=1566827 RepID=A0A8J3A366_9PROT|nr:phosphoribosyltransferase family protein [Aquisalinus luteolus]NHK28818.1 hypoxanthine phosphoribosyltransferase [Aquisalinus luteolus]GGH99609.1 hypoxanthine phosphoribosyltransferase [Aquisalinus luteolus]
MRTLYTEDQIAGRLATLGEKIVEDLGTEFVLIPILTGGFVFGADLARAINRAGGDCFIDTLHLASYGDKHTSSGVVKLLKDLTKPIEGKTVLLADDVLDSGRSLYFAAKLLEERGAASVKIAVAVDKQTGRAEPVHADYAAFTAGPDDFLVGYGMDDAGQKRGLPFIGAL